MTKAIENPEQFASTIRINAKQAAMLQLAPGIASLPVFTIFAAFFANKGLPVIFALMVAC